MEFLRIERALNRLVGESTAEGRFYRTARVFDKILSDESLSPREKTNQIAEIIEQGIVEKQINPES